MDDNTANWLRLRHTHGLGNVGVAQLLEALGSVDAILGASAAQLTSYGLSERVSRALHTPKQEAIDRDLAWQADAGLHPRHLIALDNPLYPRSLRALNDPPTLLYVVGDPDLLTLPQLGVVGSRSPSERGRATAQAMTQDLAQRGLTITSGLALGIDGAAHRGALAAGGLTIAVVGTGPDRIYPAQHRELAHDIGARGCIVSEFAVGVGPHSSHFPRRNRIISALSLGVLVVEATLRSGSLITARLALEQGKEVMAIPGSIHSPQSRGCHRLIRDGAKLVEGSDDVLEEIGPYLNGATLLSSPDHSKPPDQSDTEASAPLSEDEQRLLGALDTQPRALDVIATQAQMPAADAASTLLLLELNGLARHYGGGRYALA